MKFPLVLSIHFLFQSVERNTPGLFLPLTRLFPFGSPAPPGMDEMHSCPFAFRVKRDNDMCQRVGVVGEMLVLFWTAPFKRDQLIGFERGDFASDRAVILAVIGFLKQFIFPADDKLDFSHIDQPRFEQLVIGK